MEGIDAALVRAKLRAPVEPHDFLSRPRLNQCLATALAGPITVVSAAAGYGKTTTVAAFLRRSGRKAVWYRLDRNDADVGFFLTHLVAGIRQHYPDFGNELLLRLRTCANPDREGRSLFALLTAALDEVVADELVLALDDLHEADDSLCLIAGLNYLLDHLPPTLHAVIISRAETRLALEKMRVAGHVARLDELELALNQEETRELFEDIFKLSLTQSELRNLGELSRGWVIPLVMAARARRSRPAEGGGIPPLSRRELFAYFSEQMLGTMSPQVQHFLLETSIAAWLSTPLVCRYCDTDQAGSILEDLGRGHVFLSAEGDPPIYRYHPLWRDFLQERLAVTCGAKRVHVLRRRVARLMEAAGAIDEAVEQYLLAETPLLAARLLERRAMVLVRGGYVHRVHRMVEKLDRPILAARPLLLVAWGRAFEARGDHQLARRYYDDAERSARAFRQHRAQGEALAAMGRLERLEGRLPEAIQLLETSLGQLRGERRRAVLADLVGAYAVTDQFHRAERLCEQFRVASHRAKDLQGEYEALHILGFLRFLYLGQPELGMELLQAAVRAKQKQGTQAVIPITEATLAFFDLLQGEGTARRQAEEAMKTADDHGLAREGALARVVLAGCLVQQGLADEALPLIEEAVRVLNQIRDPWFLIIAYTWLCRLHERQDNRSGATNALRRLHESAEALGSDYYRAWTLLVDSAYQARSGDDEAGRKALAQAFVLADRCRTPFLLIPAHIMLAFDHCTAKRAAPAADALKTAADLLAAHPYRGFPGLNATEVAQMVVTMERTLPELRATADAILRVVRPEKPMSFSLLGTFTVLEGGTPVDDVWWHRPRVVTLCKFLLVNRGRVLRREEVTDALWPDLPPEAARNNLRWSLSVLRRLLGQRVTSGAEAAGGSAGRSSLILRLRHGDSVDVDEFEAAIGAAQSAATRGDKVLALQQVVNLYRGDFLPESLYEDWTINERERLRHQFLNAAQELASLQEEAGDVAAALAQWQRLLKYESDNEMAHCGAMRCFGGLGRIDAVRRQYGQCVDGLRRGLDAAPSPATVALFKRLTNRGVVQSI